MKYNEGLVKRISKLCSIVGIPIFIIGAMWFIYSISKGAILMAGIGFILIIIANYLTTLTERRRGV